MARIIEQYSRIQNHIITETNTECTVPRQDDFTDTSDPETTWTINDVLDGEFGVNTTDKRLYIRMDDQIRTIPTNLVLSYSNTSTEMVDPVTIYTITPDHFTGDVWMVTANVMAVGSTYETYECFKTTVKCTYIVDRTTPTIIEVDAPSYETINMNMDYTWFQLTLDGNQVLVYLNPAGVISDWRIIINVESLIKTTT